MKAAADVFSAVLVAFLLFLLTPFTLNAVTVSGGGSSTSSSSSSTGGSSGPPPCTPCPTDTNCSCSGTDLVCTYTDYEDCGWGCQVTASNTFTDSNNSTCNCDYSIGGTQVAIGAPYEDSPCLQCQLYENYTNQHHCDNTVTSTFTGTSIGCSCVCTSPNSWDPCGGSSGGSSSSSSSSSGGFSCGANVAGVVCSPDVIYIPSAATVTLTVTDVSWNTTGQVEEGTFVGGFLNGPVVENFFSHSEATQPTFVMRQINSITSPGYPYPLSDTSSGNVDYDHNIAMAGIPYGLNTTKVSSGPNMNVDAAGHYSYTLTFNVTVPTRFSIIGNPVLSGGTQQSLNIGFTSVVPGPTVSGLLDTANLSTNTHQSIFNAGDNVRLNWQVIFH